MIGVVNPTRMKLSNLLSYPFSTLIFILVAFSAFRTKSLGIDQIIFRLIDDTSKFKVIAFIFSILIIPFFEYYSNNHTVFKFKRKSSRWRVNLVNSSTNRTVRFMTIVAFINFLTWMNLSPAQSLASNFYSLFRIGTLYPQFADLRTTLFGISCAEVTNIGSYISCGNRGNNWTYPTILLELRAFSIDPDISIVIMPLLLFLISICIFILMKKFPTRYFYFIITFFVLPPFLIAIERGNLDIIIFCLILFILLITRNAEISSSQLILISLALAIGSFLKFYPIIGLVILLYFTLRNEKQDRRIASWVVLSVGVITLLILFKDFSGLQNQSVSDLSGSIGLRNIVALTLGLKDSSGVTPPQLCLCLVLFSLIFYKLLWKTTSIYQDLKLNQRLEVLITSSIAFLPWLTASNYYYRLILIWPLVYSLIRVHILNEVGLNALFRLVLFPTVFGFALNFRTFALVQNVAISPICLLFIFFVVREIAGIRFFRLTKFR